MKDDSRCIDNVRKLVHVLNIMNDSVGYYFLYGKAYSVDGKYQLLIKCYILLEHLGLHIISK